MPYFIVHAAGALLYGALYLLSVVIAGFVFGHPWASLLAIIDMGITYLSFSFNLFALNRQPGSPGLLIIGNCLTIVTILLGVCAGILLLS